MMRCNEVIDDLAAPMGPISAEVAEHLAGCPRCAAWARRDARLERLWEATRPEEPSSLAWASVWGNVTRSLPSSTMAPLSAAPAAPGRLWRRWVRTTLGVAQAAVLLLAAWLGSRPDMIRLPHRIEPRAGSGLAQKPAPTAVAAATGVASAPQSVDSSRAETEIDIPDGVLLVIHSDGHALKLSQLPDDGSRAVDSSFVFFNKVEGMAGKSEALAE